MRDDGIESKPPDDCPSVETISDWVGGLLHPAFGRSTALHVEQCERCAQEAALARVFAESAGSEPRFGDAHGLDSVLARTNATIRRLAGARSGRRTALAFAFGSGLAAAALVIVIWPEADPNAGPLPLSGSLVPRGVPAIATLEPSTASGPPPEVFRWAPVDGAHAYTLEIRDAGGAVVSVVDTAENTWRASRPAETFLGASRYTWKVMARDRAGRLIAESPLSGFRVERPLAPDEDLHDNPVESSMESEGNG